MRRDTVVDDATPDETWPTADVLHWLATRSPEDATDAWWDAVHMLHDREPTDVWRAVEPLSSDPDPRARRVVPEVLLYLGGEPPARREETVALLTGMLHRERDARVLSGLGLAVVELDQAVAVELLPPLARHPDREVREVVIQAMVGSRDPRAIDTLIAMAEDPSATNRDLVQFALGRELGAPGEPDLIDTPSLRDALLRGMLDQDANVRGEARRGLAIRGMLVSEAAEA